MQRIMFDLLIELGQTGGHLWGATGAVVKIGVGEPSG
jgi:hypothetical protein